MQAFAQRGATTTTLVLFSGKESLWITTSLSRSPSRHRRVNERQWAQQPLFLLSAHEDFEERGSSRRSLIDVLKMQVSHLSALRTCQDTDVCRVLWSQNNAWQVLWILVIDWSSWVFLLEHVEKYNFPAYAMIKNTQETLNTV